MVLTWRKTALAATAATVVVTTLAFVRAEENSDRATDDVPLYSGGYRGPDRNGIYPAEDLLKKWPEGGPEMLWKYEGLGEAWSSVTIHDDKAYVLGGINPGILYAFDLDDGELVWKLEYGPDRREGRFAGSRNTVEVRSGRAYFATGQGVVHCVDLKARKVVWSVDTVKKFGNKIPGHGYNITPLLHDGKIICPIRRGKHTHVALDMKTGKVVWTNKPSTYAIGDSSPVLLDGDPPLVVDSLWHAFVVLRPDTGKIVWTYKDGRTGTMMTPVVRDGYVFADMGRHRATMFHRTDDPNQPLRKLWQLDHGLDDISQALILDDTVFYLGRTHRMVEEVVERKGKKETRTVRQRYMAMWARDVKTGKLLKSEQVRESGSLSAADGMIYLVTGGEKNWKSSKGIEAWISLIRPTKGGFEQVSHFKPVRGKKEVWINAAIADGKLLFRQGRMLSAYDISAESDSR